MSFVSTSPCETGWRAQLTQGFAQSHARTILTDRRHVGPLRVQRPFYPEGGICHVYVVHPPGGIVAGDDLQLQVSARENAHAVLTTPAATKFYRAFGGREARLVQQLDVAGAALEWLPQETLYFSGAQASSLTRVQLDAQSRFLGWEISCFGKPANQETFAQGRIRQALEVWLGERPLLLDHLRIEGGGEPLRATWGFGNCAAIGSLLAYPANGADLAAVRESLAARPHLACSVSLLGSLLLCRALGRETSHVRRALQPVWELLRPRLLGVPPVPPRIWAT